MVVQNSNTSMGVGSLLCMNFALLEQVGPDQPGFHHFPGLRWLACSTLGLSTTLLAGNHLSAGGTGVGLSIDSAATTKFSSSTCSRLLLMGDR